MNLKRIEQLVGMEYKIRRILTFELPKGFTAIGFAADIGVTIEVLTNEPIWKIKSWLEDVDFAPAEHETRVVLIPKRRKETSIKIMAKIP